MNSLLLPLILLALVGFGGGFIQRVSGFGLGIFAMLFLPYICPDTAFAAAVSCLWSCVTSLYNAVKYRKDANLKLLVPLICTSIVTIPVAPGRSLAGIAEVATMNNRHRKYGFNAAAELARRVDERAGGFLG